MALWAILALTAAGLFVFFLLLPALLVFFAVFGKKKNRLRQCRPDPL